MFIADYYSILCLFFWFCFPSAFFCLSQILLIPSIVEGHLLDPVFPTILVGTLHNQAFPQPTLPKNELGVSSTSELCATNPVAISKSSFCFYISHIVH